jgi:FdhD protein
MPLPVLTQASTLFTHEVQVINESGERLLRHVPSERPLTLYLDRHELVTVMTAGTQPELLALGWLRNQRFVQRIADIAAVQVDWDVSACVITRQPAAQDDASPLPLHGVKGQGASGLDGAPVADTIPVASRQKTVTSGCGQGTMFGQLMDYVEGIALAPHRVARSVIQALAECIRLQPSLYKISGSVHGCALFSGEHLLLFTEDVGRHNALDAIAGWMWLHAVDGHDKLLYTTGRLTSEMVIKAAQMGVAIVVSRSGVTEMGLQVARDLGMCLIGRCINKHFLLYCGEQRIDLAN